MKITKITEGYVAQVFDSSTGKLISQEFHSVASEYERDDGTPASKGEFECYHPFDMVQPSNS